MVTTDQVSEAQVGAPTSTQPPVSGPGPVSIKPSLSGAKEVFGILVSKLEYPVVISYGEEQIRLSSRGQTGILEKRLLTGSLPLGVVFVPRPA